MLLAIPELADVPFLVLGNKIDVRGAMSEDAMRCAMGLYETSGKHMTSTSSRADLIRPIELFMCSVHRKMGYADGFQWLSRFF